MSDALRNLFTDQANAIREGLGNIGLITPADFPARTREIVAMIGSGGGGSSADVRYVTFMSYDGSIEYIKLPVAVGYDCPEPKIDDPTRESTEQYNYAFAGWATTVNGALDGNALKAVEEDRTVYANFAAVVRYYTVNYYDEDGVTLLKTKSVTHGEDASYTPEKEGYKFIGWSEDVTNVTEDIDVYAIWEVDDGYIHDSWETVVTRVKDGTAANYYKPGSKIALPLSYVDGTSETVDVHLVGYNLGVDMNENPVNATFYCANALQESSPFFTNSIMGSGISSKYATTELVKLLNDDVLPALPDVLQDNILERKHLTKTYISGQKLWIAYSIDWNGNTGNHSAKLYSLFPTSQSRVRYKKGSDTPVEYWAGDISANGSYVYGSYISTTGTGPTLVTENPSKTARGVVFGFCI